MGIQGLLPLLKSIQRDCSLKKFAGMTLGVDAYGWLHRGTTSCAVDVALEKPTNKFVEFAMNRVHMLVHFGVTPYIVFDGDYLPSKAATESERAKKREDSKRLGQQLLNAGKTSQAHAELQKAVDVTPEMARQWIDELKKHGIQYVVAPYEADAQLAYLEKKGHIQGVLSEDSDMLVFGVKRLITKLGSKGECVEINRKDFSSVTDVLLIGWTDEQFRQMAILSGCDYLDSVKNMGLKTAHRLLRKHKKIEHVIRALQFDGKKKVPQGYLEAFKKAELTFLHQYVFCPKKEMAIMAAEPKEPIVESVDFLGQRPSLFISQGVARGDLHPMTKEPLLSNGPALVGFSMPRGYNGFEGRKTLIQHTTTSTPVLSLKGHKPINHFFKARRFPLTELDPNTLTPSPTRSGIIEVNSTTWYTSPLLSATPATDPLPSTRIRTSSIRSSSISFGLPTPKRSRLCDDEHDDEVFDRREPATESTSKFFSAASEVSPLAVKKSRKKAETQIHSDDSFEAALRSLPDVEAGAKAKKLAVFREESSSKESSFEEDQETQNSISTTATSTSLLVASQGTLMESKSKTTITHSQETPEAGNIEKVLEKKLTNDKVPADDNLDAKSIDAVAGRDELVPETPEKAGGANLVGSEDCLVPDSEDEETVNTTEKPKVNLGRFLYSE